MSDRLHSPDHGSPLGPSGLFSGNEDAEQVKEINAPQPSGCLWKTVVGVIGCSLLLASSWGCALVWMAVVPSGVGR